MYFAESSRLISLNPLDKDKYKRLDRELAHSYAPGGSGYIELPLLAHKVNLPQREVDNLMGQYEQAGVVVKFEKVECPCGEVYDPNDGSCMNCNLDISHASPTGEFCYRISLQPQQPAFSPNAQPTNPTVFISYRHSDSGILAADIYYSLLSEGHSVFLDDGSIPVGANADQLFLSAASNADHFIALVSIHYFESDFCKREIAHAARNMRRLIRVNIPPVPPAPHDMPWINSPNWNNVQGDVNGLSSALEQSLLSVVLIRPSPITIADLRLEACQFLMGQMSLNELEGLWNRLSWMAGIRPPNAKNQIIGLILQEVTSARLNILCNALAPS